MSQKILAAAVAMFAATVPQMGSADDVEDALQFALEAYQAGDIKSAQEEVAFAAQLLQQLKTAGLSEFLPEALNGWVRNKEDDNATAAALGGSFAKATYHKEGESSYQVTIALMADNQMVVGFSAMFSNTALMGALGTVKRIGRQKVVVKDDEVQSMIDSRILIQITGNATLENKEAYFAEIDVRALAGF